MRAYLFWHRAYASVAAAEYERSLTNFHRALAERSPPGFRGSATYRVPEMPWLGGAPGYEDWYLVDGSWALDPLNDIAVVGPMGSPHTAVAAPMEVGCGGLYALAWGEAALPEQRAETWLSRPRGIQWQPALEPLRRAYPGLACWRRQMVLGPAPEFLAVGSIGQQIEAPNGWRALPMAAVRIGT